MVQVRAQPSGEGWVCDVIVVTEHEETRHAVTVRPGDLQLWGTGDDSSAVEDLVSRSFAFLLAREAPGSILPTFDLSVIQRYFPDFDRTIKR